MENNIETHADVRKHEEHDEIWSNVHEHCAMYTHMSKTMFCLEFGQYLMKTDKTKNDIYQNQLLHLDFVEKTA